MFICQVVFCENPVYQVNKDDYYQMCRKHLVNFLEDRVELEDHPKNCICTYHNPETKKWICPSCFGSMTLQVENILSEITGDENSVGFCMGFSCPNCGAITRTEYDELLDPRKQN